MRVSWYRQSKYGNKEAVVNGERLDSKKEAKRYIDLMIMLKAGHITNLRRQVKYVLIPSQKIDGKVVERECSYIADFVYKDRNGNTVVEDTKGFRTPEYKIKRKMMLYVHGIRIKEI